MTLCEMSLTYITVEVNVPSSLVLGGTTELDDVYELRLGGQESSIS
jgi:hypothetical protein